MSGADESSPDTSPTLFDTAMYETATEKRWPTPNANPGRPNEGNVRMLRAKVLAGEMAESEAAAMLHGGKSPLSAQGKIPANSRSLISSAAASPASPSATLAGDWVPPTPAGSGPNSCESYARLGPDGCWLKMYQDSFQLKMDGSLEECSGTWPRAGTMRNGTAYRRPPLVPRTSAIGSSSWPTPQAHDTAKGNPARVGRYGTKHGGRNLNDEAARWPTPQAYSHGPDSNPPGITKLDVEVRQMYPTPTQADGTGGPGSSGRDGGENLRTKVGGQLNPRWVEWLMGFPLGWTDLEGSATPSSPRSPST
jgi:hypothetical protein